MQTDYWIKLITLIENLSGDKTIDEKCTVKCYKYRNPWKATQGDTEIETTRTPWID